MRMMITGEERVVPLAEMTPLEVLGNINPPPLLLRVIASTSSSPSAGNFCLGDYDYRSKAILSNYFGVVVMLWVLFI